MLPYQIFYRVAFLVTALVHLRFNNLIETFVAIVVICLSNSRQPIFQSILRLHSVVLICFVLAFCFNTVSARPGQRVLQGEFQILNVRATFSRIHKCAQWWLTVLQFDDIETPDGFGNIPLSYNGFVFNDFYAFKPSHPRLDGIISAYDLNCAVSRPNALYGAASASPLVKPQDRQGTPGERPSIWLYNSSETFTVHALKIKPLDMPIGSVTINLQGFRSNDSDATLTWKVDFPADFHDVLDVRVEKFTRKTWDGLSKLEMWAVFHLDDVTMEDWEFCVDDIELEVG
ncbi:uncharacterized protein Z519_06017 [Cladophialophora bantiana CBS 173.52]|uniref:NADH:ubiquinone oxidoreductase intermediate-associated protein 30 domain-containing protein n=1 Tax=Cladophialophora bantiana (strain ATCC 10958 / CBS 173.52 / CDC B-1940 / NIH 8579) TaxID=1442370 RepID=A0A0D2G418_CLAB1|nr:uncharacterized protein Z519_06017 [Cladophialophora bantiana CBS 173.52]KIW93412.1 hypothetical protein Z519_06017 [Cladophialophora bantiana CBS 173.52]